jgi:uncharacterized protein YceH (UPF0502 family)
VDHPGRVAMCTTKHHNLKRVRRRLATIASLLLLCAQTMHQLMSI